MISLNIVTESKEWILSRSARELLQLEGFQVTINFPTGDSDIDYFIPYLLFKGRTHKNKSVGLFTHLETALDKDSKTKANKFHAFKKEMDLCISISKKTREALGQAFSGSPVIKLGTDLSKTPIFGVVGRVQRSGRKNEKFIESLANRGFRIVAWGEGWPCEIVSRNYSDISKFYRAIDYLIIPSSIEGGPVPLLESLAMGTPVIAPDVGWAWEFPVIKYERDNFQSLLSVMQGLTQIPTWESWREEHRRVFSELVNHGSGIGT